MALDIDSLPTPVPSRADPTNFASRADAFLTALPQFATQTNALADEVQINANSAETSKNAASSSATNAASSAATALTHKNAAATSETNAASSAAAALTSKNAAAASQTAAAASQTAAATSATNAASSASAAATSATNASNSASAAATSATSSATSATNASSSASAAATSATNAAASASQALSSKNSAEASALTAVNAPGTNATSSTSNTIDLVTPKTFTIQTGKALVAGQFLSIAFVTNPLNYLLAQIQSYNSVTGQLIVNVIDAKGSGTYSSWSIGLTAASNGVVQVNSVSDSVEYLPVLTNAAGSVLNKADAPGTDISYNPDLKRLTVANVAGNASSATQLATARNITLNGDVTGTASFNGTADANVTATVVDDSHNHTTATLTGFVEAVEDIVGAMVSANTEAGIAVTYDDTVGKLNFDVGDFTITLAGDLTGSATITNLASATLTATVAANSVALGTDTTGNYAGSVAVSGVGLSLTGVAGEGTAFTVNSNATAANTANTIVSRDAAGAIAIGALAATSGTVSGDFTVTGNLVTSGGSTVVNSTVTVLEDPVLTLGGNAAPTVNDGKDRGIEFRWHDGTSAKLGFFGFDRSTGFMTFIPDASNTNEVFTGSIGTLDVAAITGSAARLTTARTISLTGDVTGSVSFDGSANASITATIAPDSVALGTDTTGNYAASVAVSGNGLTITGAAGEGTAYTVNSNATSANSANAIVSRDASGNFSAGTISAALAGNSTTATTLQTARTIAISGGVTGTATSFNGGANIAIPVTAIDVSTANAGTLAVARGGTGATAVAQGGVVYGASTTAYGATAAGTQDYILKSNAAGAPTWTVNDLTSFPSSAFKKAARVATTAALTLNTAQTTIDGITITASDRVLVKDQATAAQNGIYTNLTTTTWTRVTDADTSAEVAGAMVPVDEGTVNGGMFFKTSFKPTDTLDTTPMSWFAVVDADGSTYNLSITGNAGTATALQTARTISLTGDVTGSVSFNGTANATISTTIAPNSVALGADTTGNYAGSVTVSGVGLTITGAAGEGTNFSVNSNATAVNTANTIVSRDASGNFSAGTITASLSGSASAANNLNSTRTNWNDLGVINAVVGQVAWKNFGNGHTIFDASNSTSPQGSALSNVDAQIPWAATYPTLMGWNGSNSYGVRVDSARRADSAASVDNGVYNNGGTYGINITGSASSATSATNATNATNSTNLNVTTSAANANYPLVFAPSQTTGQQALLIDSSGGTYNPSTNAAAINITGNAATASNGGVTSVNGQTGAVTVDTGAPADSAQSSVTAIGSYIFGLIPNAQPFNPGATFSGTQIEYSSVTGGGPNRGTVVNVGTWRVHGYNANVGSTTATVFQRIA